MENQIRIVTTKRGYERLIKCLKGFKDEKLTKAIINEDTCKFYGKNIVFIKWDNPIYYKVIKTLIMTLMGYGNSYRICVKEGEKVNMYSDETIPNEHIKLPMPIINCNFNDEGTIKKLSEFKRSRKSGENKNGI